MDQQDRGEGDTLDESEASTSIHHRTQSLQDDFMNAVSETTAIYRPKGSLDLKENMIQGQQLSQMALFDLPQHVNPRPWTSSYHFLNRMLGRTQGVQRQALREFLGWKRKGLVTDNTEIAVRKMILLKAILLPRTDY
jgi:hypothetical protein